MISKILNTIVAGVSTLLLVGVLHAQDAVVNHYEKLKKIQDEINSVKKEIAANEKKESSLLYVLTNLDLDIDLTQSLIQRIRTEQKRKERQIAKIEENLKTTRRELKRLNDIMSKRLVHFYKYGRLKDIELLLTTRSVNQGLLWIEYQRRLSAHDRRNYLKIKEKQAKIAHAKELLTQEVEKKRKLLQDKMAEERKLKAQKKERQKVLVAIRKNTTLFRQQLAEKRQAEAEITRLILKLEKAPMDAPLAIPETPFADLQGRMIWPAKGKVVAKFGKYKHPDLKTVTENIGIDIQAKLGSPVQVVASGRVTVITWQRGRGSIIIVKHYGGYYTVYTHLKEILVNESQDVQMGQVIGTVGESGSLEGPRLHFEVYKGSGVQNPEHWLAVQS